LAGTVGAPDGVVSVGVGFLLGDTDGDGVRLGVGVWAGVADGCTVGVDEVPSVPATDGDGDGRADGRERAHDAETTELPTTTTARNDTVTTL
jgi:hypothetical protein